MGSIRLHPSDREKYKTPDVIPFELGNIGVRQRAAFEKATKRSLKWLYEQLAGVPELDDAGNAIPEPVFNDDGSPKVTDDGSPVVRPRMTRDPETVAMLVWLALWGVGIRVPWNDRDGNPVFEIREVGIHLDLSDEDDDEDVEGEGKALTDSENTTSPTL